MKINQLHKIIFDTVHKFVAAAMANYNEVVMLMSSESVVRYNIESRSIKHLFSTSNRGIEYSDGGFDITAQSSIYTLDEIVVVVNDYKLQGFIHYPGDYDLRLHRKDYCASYSRYPIALYKNENGVPHIIYGVDWNHVQIMNLQTRQVLTATKSLIEENAEEQHIEFYKKYPEENKMQWPRGYDYFYARLSMSPDAKMFMSAGWVWGSHDAITVYDVQDFIQSNRIAPIYIGGGEHESRAVCWMNNNTVILSHNPFMDDDEYPAELKGKPDELHLCEINGKEVRVKKKIAVPGLDILHATIAYSEKLNAIIAFSEKIGVAVLDIDGKILLHESNMRVDAFYTDTLQFIKTEDKTVTVYELTSLVS